MKTLKAHKKFCCWVVLNLSKGDKVDTYVAVKFK